MAPLFRSAKASGQEQEVTKMKVEVVNNTLSEFRVNRTLDENKGTTTPHQFSGNLSPCPAPFRHCMLCCSSGLYQISRDTSFCNHKLNKQIIFKR